MLLLISVSSIVLLVARFVRCLMTYVFSFCRLLSLSLHSRVCVLLQIIRESVVVGLISWFTLLCSPFVRVSCFLMPLVPLFLCLLVLFEFCALIPLFHLSL